MRRRDFIGLVGGSAAWPVAVRAQTSKRVPAVGVLWAYPNAEVAGASRVGLLKGFAELGYVSGNSLVLEERYAGYGGPERIDRVAAELAALKPNVVVSQGSQLASALHRKDPTIPVVATGMGDPVALGYATGLSRPGGNLTGFTQMAPETAGKRLQLLKEVSMAASLVALLQDPANIGAAIERSQYPAAAQKLGLTLDVFDASSAIEIDQAFQRMADQHIQAVNVFDLFFLHAERSRISALGLKHRLPILGPGKAFVESGSLMSYGPDYPAIWQSAAHVVDKVLKGEKVGDIPIQQPTKFEFHINLKTAKALGLTVPYNLLVLADEVIE